MNSTTTSSTVRSSAATRPSARSGADTDARTQRLPIHGAWPFWGAAAGVLGAVGHLLTMPTLSEAEYLQGPAYMEQLDRGGFHVGIVAGMAAVFCLLFFAAGWRRLLHQGEQGGGGGSLAAAVVPLALTASAGAMLLGYGFKGSLAIYLPGGSDAGTMPYDGLYSLFMFNDLGPYMAWWGVAMAGIAIAWLALRERALPLWFGVVSVLFALPPIGMLLVTGLPGFPGVVHPLWLLITGVGMGILGLRARNGAEAPVASVASVASLAVE